MALHLAELLLVAALQQGLTEQEFLQIATQLSVGLQIEAVNQPTGTRLVIDVASVAAVGEHLTGQRVPESAVVAAITPMAAPAPWGSFLDCTMWPCRLTEYVVAVRVDSATIGPVRFTEPVVEDVQVLQLYISIVVPREDPAKEGPPCGFHMRVFFFRDETGRWLLDRLSPIDMC